MLKTIAWFTYLWVDLFLSITDLARVKYYELTGQPKKADAAIKDKVRTWAKKIVEKTGTKVTVKGEENLPNQPALFVCNHQSAFDIPLLLGFIGQPKSFIAKWSLRYVPFMSSWMKRMNCIFIKRNNFRQTLKAFKNAGKVFANDYSLVVFPEGTRSKSGKLNKFKKGSLKIAIEEGVPIVPVTIKDSHKIWEGNNNLINDAEVELIISQPISQNRITNHNKRELATEVRNIIAQELAEVE